MCAVRVGLIGTGFGASIQVPGFKCVSDVEVVAITSRRLERAEAVAVGAWHTSRLRRLSRDAA